MDAPGGYSQNVAKSLKSYIFTPPIPQGHVMSLKCEQPLDELKSPNLVTVWPSKL